MKSPPPVPPPAVVEPMFPGAHWIVGLAKMNIKKMKKNCRFLAQPAII